MGNNLRSFWLVAISIQDVAEVIIYFSMELQRSIFKKLGSKKVWRKETVGFGLKSYLFYVGYLFKWWINFMINLGGKGICVCNCVFCLVCVMGRIDSIKCEKASFETKLCLEGTKAIKFIPSTSTFHCFKSSEITVRS